MIKAFVTQKRASQARIYSNSGKKESSGKNFFLKLFNIIWMKFVWSVIIIFSLVYIVIFVFKHTLFVPEYIIKNVWYSSGSLSQIDDPYLYKAISAELKSENYYIVKFYKRSILNKIKSAYPIVNDLIIEYKWQNTVGVKVLFNEPDIVVKSQDKKWWVYKDYVFDIYSGNTIWKDVLVLNLPLYASGLDNIYWLFFKQGVLELKEQLNYIYEAFPGEKTVSYLAWWERTVVILWKKTIYINNLADIPQQIKNFDLLKKYYEGYDKLDEIDLGSLEMDKIIVR